MMLGLSPVCAISIPILDITEESVATHSVRLLSIILVFMMNKASRSFSEDLHYCKDRHTPASPYPPIMPFGDLR